MVQTYWPDMDQAVDDVILETPSLFWVHLYLIFQDQQLF